MGIINKTLPPPDTKTKPTIVMTGTSRLSSAWSLPLSSTGGLGIVISRVGNSGWMRGGRSMYSTAMGQFLDRQHTGQVVMSKMGVAERGATPRNPILEHFGPNVKPEIRCQHSPKVRFDKIKSPTLEWAELDSDTFGGLCQTL